MSPCKVQNSGVRVTLKQIAELSQVSRMTASMILNGSPENTRASEETRARVREVAARLNYQPNRIAQALSGGSVRIIGVLLDSIVSNVAIKILESIEKAASKRGYHLMVAVAHEDISRLYESFQIFNQYKVAGVISLVHTYPGREDEVRRCFGDFDNIVFIDKPPTHHRSYVEIDEGAGIRLAVERLLSQGRRRIGMLIERSDYANANARLNAFRASSPSPELVAFLAPEDTESPENGRSLLKSGEEFILGNRLDAVIAASDLWANSIVNDLARRGIRIPEDVAVIGSGNTRNCIYCDPPLSSLDLKPEIVAEESFAMFCKVVAGKMPEPVVIVPQLIIRGSSEKMQ